MRLATQLDHSFNLVNSARDHLARVPAILKRFRQAVLAAACSGRLTEDWRLHHAPRRTSDAVLEEIRAKRAERAREYDIKAGREPARVDVSQLPDVPESWTITNLDQLSCFVTSGSRGWAKYYAESGPLFIRAQDINTDRLQSDGIAHVRPPRNAEGLRTRVCAGDLLVTITGANVTKSALVDREIEEAYVSQHVALVRLVDSAVGPFLYLWTISPIHGRAKLLADAYGAGKPGLNLDNIKEMSLALPSPDEQAEIGRRVATLFSLADDIENRVFQATRCTNKLTQSILAKAFRGELVPTEAELARREGREYEPASALLEKIKAERTLLESGKTQRLKRATSRRAQRRAVSA
jgi:type I restriction enzyme S subunit